jgi:Spy/CpxP family protein refolding chaperone
MSNMKKPFVSSLVAGLLCVSALVASAEPGRGGQRAGGLVGGGRGRGSPPDAAGTPALTLRQQQLLQQNLQKDADKLRGLEEKLRVAQQEILAAALASPFDQKALQGKAEAVAKVQADITLLRAKALSAVAQTMRAADKQQLAASPTAPSILTGETADGGIPATGGGDPGGSLVGGGRRGASGGGLGGALGANAVGAAGATDAPITLSAEQQQIFLQTLEKDMPRLRNMSANLRSAINDLLVATVASNYDARSIQEKAAAVTGVQVAIAAMRLKGLAAAAQTMTPEQRRQLAESPATFQALSESTPGVGAGRGGGGGRGAGPLGGGRDSLPKER